MSKEILELIENVDPSDTDTLDEIDGLFWGYYYKEGCQQSKGGRPTRSRDALKSIRPEGWQYRLEHDFGSDCFLFTMTKWGARCVPKKYIDGQWDISKPIKTEELAELHAIIQAIEWERKSK